MAERNIRLLIEYAGTRFSGWQSQDGPSTIQDEIEEAIHKITGQKVRINAAGRTDVGVHALGQVANFKIDHRLETERFKDAINNYLPDEIMVKSATEANSNFNSRKDAVSRHYRYLYATEKSALYRSLRWEDSGPVSLEKLKQAALTLLGEHDFSAFCVVASLKDNNRCLIEHSEWHSNGPLFTYDIVGNRFLHSMVRSVVGSMINLATENQDQNSCNLTLDDFKNMLSSPDGERAQFTAPSRGLYLVSVSYNEEVNK